MNIVFRANAGPKTGSGHLRRCMTLGEALLEAGHRCDFLLEEACGFEDSAIPRHFGIRRVDSTDDGVVQLRRIRSSNRPSSGLREARVDWLVVDDYHLDARWETGMRRVAERIFVIDDLANRRHDCDLLLDQAYFRRVEDYEGLVASDTELLIGPSFALLRPRFAALRAAPKVLPAARDRANVYLSIGGTDPQGLVGDILRAIKRDQEAPRLCVRVVISSAAAHLDELREIVERLPYECHLHIDKEQVAELMADSDVAISGGGMTSYELACLGVPTLVIPASTVEAQVAEALALHSVVSVVRGPLDNPEASIATQFQALLSGLDVLDPRQGPSAHIDGQGLERVVAAMSSRNDRGA